MVNLKSRIENLKKETGAMAVKELCEKAIAKIEDINEMHTSLTAKSEIENGIIEKFISDVKRMKVNDTETRKFLEREERFFNINNLGVKAAINKIAESDLTEHPALRYAINAFAKRTNVPEYIIAEEFVSVMHPFEWHPVVKECLSVIREKANENKEDFIIHKSIYNLKNSRSSYILSGINESIDDYLMNRTKASKARLVEKLNKFIFDPMVRDLANVVRESETLNVTSNSAAKASKIYAPVIVNENSETFGIGDDFYEKSGNTIRRLSENEIKNIDPVIVELSKFIAGKNVSITSEGITILSNTKKVQLVKENDNLRISVNGKEVTHADFNKIFSNAGVFRPYELKVMESINCLIENYDAIVEVEFAKRIESNLVENRRVDIIKLDESIYITQNDPSMGKRNFFKNLNAIQTKTLVNEFLSYDVSEAFVDMITVEHAEIKAIEETKKAYIQTISQLEEKLNDLSKIKDTAITESAEFQSIVKVLEEEINDLKAEYNEYVATVHNKTTLNSANEEVMAAAPEETKPDMDHSLMFSVGEKVKCLKGFIGSVIGLEDSGNRVVVLFEDGSTKVMRPQDLTSLEASNESKIEIKVDGKEIEIDSKGDEEEEEKEEEKEKEAKSTEVVNIEESLQSFNVDSKVKTHEGEFGTVIAINSVTNKLTVLMDNGKTINCGPGSLTLTGEDSIVIEEEQLKETSIEGFEVDMKVQNKEGEFGYVTAIDSVNNKVTVLYSHGVSKFCDPNNITIVKPETETIVKEGEGAGDIVKLQDGRNATVQGKSDADDTLTVVTDDGETLVVKASEVEIINDLSKEEEEQIKGQQDKGTAVRVEE